MAVRRFSYKTLIVFTILILLFITLIASMLVEDLENARNFVFAPFELKIGTAIREMKPNDLDLSNWAGADAQLSNIELRSISAYENKYTQDGKYLFRVTPHAIYDVGLQYDTTIYNVYGAITEGPSHKYVLCEISGILVFAKVAYDAEITSGESLTGVFVPMEDIQAEHLEYTLGVDYLDNVCPYQLDTLNMFYSERLGSMFFTVIGFAAIAWLIFVLVKLWVKRRPLF